MAHSRPAVFVRPLTELNEPVFSWPEKTISVDICPGEFETVVVANADAKVKDTDGLEVEEFGIYAMRNEVDGVSKDVPFYLVPRDMPCDNLSSLSAIRIHVPRGTPPGKRLVKLKSGDLSVEVQILPFELPRADIPFGMYWDCARYPQQYLQQHWKQILEDMRDHGQTSFTVYGRPEGGESMFLPDGSFNPSPQNFLTRHVQIGLDVGLLSNDIPVMMLSFGFDEDPKVAAKQADKLKAKAKEKGWPELLFYSVDEPNPAARPQVAKFHARMRELGFRVITAVVPSATAWIMGEYLDIWVVHIDVTSALQEYARRRGAEVWTYNCVARGTNPRFQRHYAGLYTWATKLEGNFLWAYVHYPESMVKPDGTWAPRRMWEYILPTPKGPIPTVGWEGRRDGIVDYRVIRLLEEKLLSNPTHPQTPEVATWLDDLRHRALANPWGGRSSPASGRWNHPDTVEPPGFEAGDYDAIRRKAIAYILGYM
jgi:hypothetical protein